MLLASDSSLKFLVLAFYVVENYGFGVFMEV